MTPDTSPKTLAEATLDTLIGDYVERKIANSLDTGEEFKSEIRTKLDYIDGQIQQVNSSLHDVINRVCALEESAGNANAVTLDEFTSLKDNVKRGLKYELTSLKDAVKQGLESTLKSLSD